MIVRADRDERAGEALAALAEAGAEIAAAGGLAEALDAVAAAVVRAAAADVAVVRVADEQREFLTAWAVANSSQTLVAELEGSRFPAVELAREVVDDITRLPETVRRAATRAGATEVLQLPIVSGGELEGSLEVLRGEGAFDEAERRVVRLAAGQAALAIRAFAADRTVVPPVDAGAALTIAGDALAAAGDDAGTGERLARLAAEATGALASLLWRQGGGAPELVASFGLEPADVAVVAAAGAVERARRARGPVNVERIEGGVPSGAGVSATLQLGQPPVGALQLLFRAGGEPSEPELAALATFGVRAAQVLRTSERSTAVATELERTRALLGIVGQAISQLSLAHSLETAVARVAELLGTDRLAVYLHEDGRLYAAAGIGLAGPHVRLAERLLELALGPFRSRGTLVIPDVRSDPRLASVGDAAAEAGIEGAIAVPLLVADERVGLLAVFPPRGRVLSENELALLVALAAQLAVVVQNAQLHERTKLLGEERKRALDSERAATRQLRALYEISRSFAQSLSLDATLTAVARTVTDVLDVDLALIHMPDERRELLEPHALHVTDERLEEAARAIVWREQPFGARPIQRLFRLHEPFRLVRRTVRQIGRPTIALLPFLERGWTGAVVPIATPAEVVGSLTLISTQPGSPVTEETIDRAQAIAGQAALAIDNARLYQQQKAFSDTMQRSLLPRSLPKLSGLDLGDAYESSARLEVGGDVYDFVVLEDGRLAVILGDVTGHGIEAAADMAMAKFVFRSLAHQHPEPGDFLRSANDVVVGEIAPGKFITMVYLVVDGVSGTVSAAGAGHPPPRLVMPDGSVQSLDAQGLVLGIESGQVYEEVHAPLEPGSAVVLYTDGVLEARHGGELYGFERLDALVSAGRELSAEDLAQTVLADCRDFAHNELADDCAVVVIKRTQ